MGARTRRATLLERHLLEACTFLRQQLAAVASTNGCVLIHCHEGKNRSATLAIAYLMVEHRMRLADAVEHVWRRRPIVLSNESFIDQLVDLAETEGLLWDAMRRELTGARDLAWRVAATGRDSAPAPRVFRSRNSYSYCKPGLTLILGDKELSLIHI